MKLPHTLSFLYPPIKKVAEHRVFISIIMGLFTLIYCIFTIQQVFNTPSDETYRSEELQKNTQTTFNKKTVEQIKQLRTTQDAPVPLPSGRVNPFVE